MRILCRPSLSFLVRKYGGEPEDETKSTAKVIHLKLFFLPPFSLLAVPSFDEFSLIRFLLRIDSLSRSRRSSSVCCVVWCRFVRMEFLVSQFSIERGPKTKAKGFYVVSTKTINLQNIHYSILEDTPPSPLFPEFVADFFTR